MIPYIWSESGIDGNGYQSIVVAIEEPTVNGASLYQGGRLVHFTIDHRKQKTEAYKMHFTIGCPQFTFPACHLWKDEVLTSSECLHWVEEHKEVL